MSSQDDSGQQKELDLMDSNELRSFKHASKIIERFEQVLASYGINIMPGSELEAICLEIHDLEEKRAGRSPIPTGLDYRVALSRAMGMLHFAELLVATYDRGRQLHTIIPHMKLFNGASVAQNVRRIGDDKTNKLFELLLALGCMNFGTEIVLDDPHASMGDNPDVMFKDAGSRWALACKVPNGDSPITAYENIKYAVEQIDRSNCDFGLVVLNARNWINHDLLWPQPGGAAIGKPDEKDIHWAWASPEMPFAMLHEEGDARFRAVISVKGEELIDVFHQSKKAIPVVLSFLQSATLVASPFGPTMFRVGTFVVGTIVDLDEATMSMISKLNEAILKLPEITGLD